ncbi:MAG: cadherin-like domain-containing protein [Verrucomicrobiota bacterium]
MKSHPSPPGAVPRYVAASLLLSLLPLTGQTLVNGNFDAQAPFTANNGYAANNGNVITGWTISNTARVGLNQAGQPFAGAAGSASGVIPSSPNVCFIQASGGTASISQVVTGLTSGTKYNVAVRFSARGGNRPGLVFTTDGTGTTIKAEVDNAGVSTAYRTAAFEFTATGTSNTITFTNDRTSGDNTLLLDNVTVTAAATTNTWSFSPWTDDTVPGSGIDSSCVYTHAVRFRNNTPVTINGVNFIGRETGTTGRFALVGYGSTFDNVPHAGVTGNSGILANNFLYGAAPSITLQNLKPLTQYMFTAYGVGFDAATTYYRAATFGSSVPGSDKFTVNLNHYGQQQGIRLNYTYTTDASGTAVVISLPATSPTLAGAWHTNGFSNREVTPRTQPTLWTIQPWNDDATSGISSNHVYTHAFKFGDATPTNYNVNGILFTGISGGNPAGANYSSANFAPITNNPSDINTVTGFGAPIAHNFLNGGFPGVHNLSGLTIGKSYIFTIYSAGWENGSRVGAFIGDVGEQMTLLNQDEYGDNNGIRFEYAYTATATTQKITVGGYDGTNSIHMYGISNREATVYVNKAPEFTLQPVGATLGIGADYTLRGATIGSPTMTYQWKKGVVDVGDDTPVLELFDVTPGDSGAYTLVVTNADGTTTSNIANVEVLENVPGYANTGLGVDGQLLAAGQVDPHFKLIVNPDTNNASDTVYVQSNLPAPWLPNSGTSKWIGPRANTANAAGVLNPVGLPSDAGAGDGVYVYRASLDLTGFTLSTVVISGKWATDNTGVKIRVNGTDVGFPNNVGVTFNTLVPFSISNTAFPGLLTTGVNTVDFYVKNEDLTAVGGYTGLRIEDFAAVGAIPPGTPPHIAVQPVGLNGPHYGTAILAVGASGSAPLSYQWFKGGDPVPDATEPVLPLSIEDLSVAGSYTVVVTGTTPVESAPAVVTVTNANPTTGFDDAGSTDEDVPKDINVFDLLANDTDADGDSLEFTSVSPTSAQGGTVTEFEGVITYTPASGYSGPDTFTYTVNDGIWGGSSTGTVAITVISAANTPPGQMSLVLSGGVATGTFTGTPGETYILERSTTLELGSWSPVDTEIAPLSGTVVVEDPSPPVGGKAFYRISYEP